jgi:hypothetical protein
MRERDGSGGQKNRGDQQMLTTSITNYTHIPETSSLRNGSIFFQIYFAELIGSGMFPAGREDARSLTCRRLFHYGNESEKRSGRVCPW